MNAISTSLATLSLAACALLTCSAAMAQSVEGAWETTFSAGADGIARESLAERNVTQLANLGTLDPALAGSPATMTLDRLSFRDALRAGPQFAFESGYWASGNFEPFVRIDYMQQRGKSLDIGAVASPALPTAAVIRADFDNRDTQSLALGGRYFFMTSGALRPYMTGYVGATHEDKLRANLESLGIGLASAPEDLMRSATKFDAGVEAGLSYAFSDRADFRLAAGADYLTGSRTQTNAFERFGLGPVELGAPHWSIPVSMGVSYRF